MPGRSRSGRQTAGRWTVAGKAFQPVGRANRQRIGNEYRPRTADGRPQNGRWTVDGGRWRWGAGFPDRQTGDGIAQEDDRRWKPQRGWRAERSFQPVSGGRESIEWGGEDRRGMGQRRFRRGMGPGSGRRAFLPDRGSQAIPARYHFLAPARQVTSGT
jgi:hypothetical protein